METTLREAVKATDFVRSAYAKEYLIGDLLPRILQFLAIAIICTQVAVRGRRLIEIQAEVTNKTSRLETELNLATEIQASMLPCIFPAFPDHVALVMADVSGKGVGAALFMTVSKIIIKNQLQSGKSIGEGQSPTRTRSCARTTKPACQIPSFLRTSKKNARPISFRCR